MLQVNNSLLINKELLVKLVESISDEISSLFRRRPLLTVAAKSR
jgi:hypothetical protein